MCDVSNSDDWLGDKRGYTGSGHDRDEAVFSDVRDEERVGDGVGDRVGDTGGDTRVDVSDDDAHDRLLAVTGAGHEDVDDYSDCCSNDDLCDGDHQYCDDRDDDDDDDDDGSECYSDVDLCDESNEDDDDDDDDVNADNFAYVNEYDDNNNHQLATSGGDYDTDTSDDDLRNNTNCDDDLDDDDDDDDDDYEDEVTDEDSSEYDDDNDDDDDDDDDDDSDRFDVVDRIKQADKHTQPHPHSTSQRRTPYAVPGLFGGHSRRTGVGRSSSRTPPPPPAGDGFARSSPGVRPVPSSRSTSLRLPVSGSRSTSGGRDSLPVHRTTSLPVARGSPTPKGRQVARGASRAPARSQSERQFLSVNPDGRPREQPTWYDPKYLRDVQCCTKYSELFCDLCACVASVLSKCHKGPHIKEFCIATTSVLFFSTLAVYMALLARAPEKLPHRCYCLLLHLIFCTVACFCTTAVSAVCGVYACDSARLAALAFSVFATVVYFTDFVHSYREYRENKPEGGATRRWPTANGRRKPSATWGALFGESLGRARASKSPAWHDITPEQAPP